MLFYLLQLYARLAIRIYCPRVVINKPDLLDARGPLLLAANHPNSFLDGIILNTLMNRPVYALARGDAFKNRLIARLLTGLRLLPVFRTSEGVENLGNNYETFAHCQKAFEKNDIVLIFSEGLCVNEWHLRPLGKGTARLATAAWKSGIPLQVIPLGINYSSFRSFGKAVHLQAGAPIDSSWVMAHERTSQQLLAFNEQLRLQLSELVYEIDRGDEVTRQRIFHPTRYNTLLWVRGAIGWLLHAPLYYLVKWFTDVFFRDSDHYDSVLVSMLMLLYPFYIFLAVAVGFWFFGWFSLLLLPVMPMLAMATARLKH